MKSFWIILVGWILVSGCTDSFFEEPDSGRKGDGSTISGRVLLKNQQSHANTYVFLTGFNSGVRTDTDGRFSISIPATGSSGSSGSYALYFYTANFKADSVLVTVVNGQIPLPQKDIDENGELKQVVELSQLIEISTVITPATILIKDEVFVEKEIGTGYDVYNNKDTAFVHATIRFLIQSGNNRVLVPVSSQSVNELAFGYIVGTNKNSIERVKDRGLGSWRDITGAPNTQRTMVFKFPIVSYVPGVDDTNILPGEYIIVPFVLVIQDNIPDALLTSLIHCPFNRFPTSDYLKIPFVYKSLGTFTVKEKSD